MLLVPRMVGWVPGGLGSQSWMRPGRQQAGCEEVASVLRAGQAPGPGWLVLPGCWAEAQPPAHISGGPLLPYHFLAATAGEAQG